MDGSATLNTNIEGVSNSEPRMSPRDYLDAAMRSPAFYPGIALALGLCLAYWNLIKTLPGLWEGNDGYYSHGFLVPFISGFIVYRRWPKLHALPIRPSWVALVPLAVVLFLLRAVSATSLLSIMSFLMVVSIALGVWFVAGWRWMVGLLAPIGYLLFALPIWSMAINTYTNPLQLLSTKVAFQMLKAFGLDPISDGSTVIYLNNFTLDVGVPCSGLKLVVALSAFTAMFILIARLKLLSNLAMVAMVLPLALIMNGLRIAMIGVVGNAFGNDAGHQFHDYSGYIMLGVCFFALFKIARLLGWKD
jgi:exosortase